jgi:hypothetical protein
MRTGTTPDSRSHQVKQASRLQVVWNCSKTEQGRGWGWHRSWVFDLNLLKCTSKCHFFMSYIKFKEICKTFLQGEVFSKNKVHKIFSSNFKSKSARSSLTSPSTTRVMVSKIQTNPSDRIHTLFFYLAHSCARLNTWRAVVDILIHAKFVCICSVRTISLDLCPYFALCIAIERKVTLMKWWLDANHRTLFT